MQRGGRLARYSLKHYYDVINSRYYRNTLPTDCRVFWSSELPENVMGDYSPERHILAQRVRGTDKGTYRKMYERKHTIRINTNLYDVGKRTVLLTLFHEIVHLKLKLRKSRHDHGPDFQKEMKRLAKVGAFSGLW